MAVSGSRRARELEPGGPSAVVDTACPLDCPDACTLAVTVRRGRIVEIDGSRKNPVTGGYICAKVRKFGERVYGPPGSFIEDNNALGLALVMTLPLMWYVQLRVPKPI